MAVLLANPKPNIKMKKFFQSIYYYFANFFKRIKFKKIEKQLGKALVDKSKEQILLLKKIKKEIDLLWPHGRSKFIPLSFPERMELRAKVYSKFGDEMQSLNIKLNHNLEFK